MSTRIFLFGLTLGLAGCVESPAEPTHSSVQVVETTPSAAVVPEDSIVAVVACLMADRCNLPVEHIRSPDGDVVHMVMGIGADGLVYSYFYTDNLHFGVAVTNPDGTTMLLTDDNLDGKVDSYVARSATGAKRQGPLVEGSSQYGPSQRLYLQAMDLVDVVVPEAIRDNVVTGQALAPTI